MIRPLRALLLLTLPAMLVGCSPARSGPSAASVSQAGAEAKAFLDKTAKAPGVVVTASGLQYKVVASGPASGPHPGPRDEVKLDYVGQLTPAVLRVEELVPAWQEALPLMRPGDEWILYVPPALGYGEQGAGGAIPPSAVLIFKIKLLGVLPAGPARG